VNRGYLRLRIWARIRFERAVTRCTDESYAAKGPTLRSRPHSARWAEIADATDWPTVVTHYDALLAAQPSPAIALNRNIAVGLRDGPATGLAELDRVAAAPEPEGYHLPPAATETTSGSLALGHHDVQSTVPTARDSVFRIKP
jgi:hypothetical protein